MIQCLVFVLVLVLAAVVAVIVVVVVVVIVTDVRFFYMLNSFFGLLWNGFRWAKNRAYVGTPLPGQNRH